MIITQLIVSGKKAEAKTTMILTQLISLDYIKQLRIKDQFLQLFIKGALGPRRFPKYDNFGIS